MNIRVESDIGGPEQIFRRMSEKMNPVLARAINDISRKIQDTARSKSTHNFTSRSGRLESRGIDMEDASPQTLSGAVFLNEDAVVDPETGARYARFVHEGTKAHDIFPKNKKMLKFVTSKNTAGWMPPPYGRFQSGKFTFAFGVHHPGTKPDRFIYEAAQKEETRAQQVFDRAMGDFIRQYGEG